MARKTSPIEGILALLAGGIGQYGQARRYERGRQDEERRYQTEQAQQDAARRESMDYRTRRDTVEDAARAAQVDYQKQRDAAEDTRLARLPQQQFLTNRIANTPANRQAPLLSALDRLYQGQDLGSLISPDVDPAKMSFDSNPLAALAPGLTFRRGAAGAVQAAGPTIDEINQQNLVRHQQAQEQYQQAKLAQDAETARIAQERMDRNSDRDFRLGLIREGFPQGGTPGQVIQAEQPAFTPSAFDAPLPPTRDLFRNRLQTAAAPSAAPPPDPSAVIPGAPEVIPGQPGFVSPAFQLKRETEDRAARAEERQARTAEGNLAVGLLNYETNRFSAETTRALGKQRIAAERLANNYRFSLDVRREDRMAADSAWDKNHKTLQLDLERAKAQATNLGVPPEIKDALDQTTSELTSLQSELTALRQAAIKAGPGASPNSEGSRTAAAAQEVAERIKVVRGRGLDLMLAIQKRTTVPSDPGKYFRTQLRAELKANGLTEAQINAAMRAAPQR